MNAFLDSVHAVELQNPEKNRTCPGCGASLVVTDESPATAPAPGTTGTQTAEKNPLTTLLVAGGAIVILLIAALVLSGFFASLFTQTVVGTYRQSGDTLGLALSEITVNADGTFTGGLLTRGTWKVEGNRLKVTYTATRLIREILYRCNNSRSLSGGDLPGPFGDREVLDHRMEHTHAGRGCVA